MTDKSMEVTTVKTIPIREALTMWSNRDRQFRIVGLGVPDPLKSCKTGGRAFTWWREPERTELELSHALLFEALVACVDGCDANQVFEELAKVNGFCVPAYGMPLL